MANLKTTNNNRKLTAAGFESCAESLRKENLHHLADALSNKDEAHDLNLFLKVVSNKRRIQMLENELVASLLTPHTFAEMKTPVLPCRMDGVAARSRDAVHPVGTMEWTFEVFPQLRAHVCEFLLAAEEMEDMVRDLTAGYNFVGIDAEDVNDILTRSNQLCKKLSLFSRINEQRLRVMAKLGRISKTRNLNPDNDDKRAA